MGSPARGSAVSENSRRARTAHNLLTQPALLAALNTTRVIRWSVCEGALHAAKRDDTTAGPRDSRGVFFAHHGWKTSAPGDPEHGRGAEFCRAPRNVFRLAAGRRRGSDRRHAGE